MYNRDIVFDLEKKIIHIYDNVPCDKNGVGMGRYLSVDEADVSNIVFSNSMKKYGINIDTNGPMFVLGIVFLTLGCLGFILIIFGAC